LRPIGKAHPRRNPVRDLDHWADWSNLSGPGSFGDLHQMEYDKTRWSFYLARIARPI